MFNVRTIITHKVVNEGMKTAGVSDYINQTPSKHFGGIKCSSPTALKIQKIFKKCVQNTRYTCTVYGHSLCKV